MIRNKVAAEIKANSKSVVLKLEQLSINYHEKILPFLESNERKILIFQSFEILSCCAKIHQVLKDISIVKECRDRSTNKLEYYVNENQYAFLEWSKLLKLHTRYDEVPISVNLLVILYPGSVKLAQEDKNALKNIFSCFFNPRKKVIFLTSHKNSLNDYLRNFVDESVMDIEKLDDQMSPASKADKENFEGIFESSDGNNISLFNQNTIEDSNVVSDASNESETGNTKFKRTIESPNCPTVIKSFHNAVLEGDITKVKKFLEIGINKKDMNDALNAVVKGGKLEILDVLIFYGAKFTTEFGRPKETLLHVAAAQGYSNIIECLAKHLIHVDYTNEGDQTPLHVAVEKGHKNVVDCLLNNGAQVNYTDTAGKTALHVAAENGLSNIVNSLLNHGAQVDYTDATGKTALHVAAEKGHIKIVECLLAHGAQVDYTDRSSRTALLIAAEKGHNCIVDFLLNHGAQVDHTDAVTHKTALHIAVEKGYKELFVALLNARADTNKKCRNGWNVLNYCAELKRSDFFNELIRCRKDLDVNLKNIINKRTALMCAAENGNIEMASKLLVFGAEINAQDRNGFTALHFATRCTRKDMVQFLLNNGADKTLTNNKRQNAAYFASDPLIKSMLSS